MPVYIDHAFITCEVGAPEADVLHAFGFREGSGNAHPGQGTANRRFFFDNFMLELLWVTNPEEAMSDRVRCTGLWERWSRRADGACRAGVVLGGRDDASSIAPLVTRAYFPAYLAAGTGIEVVQGISELEPAIYWLPWLGNDRVRADEPRNHALGVQAVTGISIGIADVTRLSDACERLRSAGLIGFFESPSSVLEIRFSSGNAARVDCRPRLPLVFHCGAASG